MTRLLFGPVMTAIIVVTIGAAAGKRDGLLGGPFMNWLIGVIVFGGLALLQGGCMLGFDALLASGGGQRLAGRSALIAGLIAPLLIEGVWAIAPPARQARLYWVALFGPIVISAGLVVWVARAVRRDV